VRVSENIGSAIRIKPHSTMQQRMAAAGRMSRLERGASESDLDEHNRSSPTVIGKRAVCFGRRDWRGHRLLKSVDPLLAGSRSSMLLTQNATCSNKCLLQIVALEPVASAIS